jgi:predicted alpha/beta hydrolase family esterase
MLDRFDFLITPGLGNSGPDHWQTHWQAHLPNAARVMQRDWDHPNTDEWGAAFTDAIEKLRRPVIVIAHSLACALVARHAARAPQSGIAAAFLVSPSDVDSPAHTPDEVRGFAPMPMLPLPFPSLLLLSSDDPFVSPARAVEIGASWGAEVIDMGPLGHMNGASQLGLWPLALVHLGRLIEKLD